MDGRAASAAVMAASGARPCEVPFSFAYFSFGQAKEK